MAKLKVFSTPIGFHDAYVAAPSRKAALTAWGSDHDLFARGIATVVTDPELIAEPLAKPGVVIKRLRGSAEEQIAALPPDTPTRAARPKPVRKEGHVKPQPAPPPPDRSTLDAAEAALVRAQARHKQEADALAAEIAECRQRQDRMRKDHNDELARLRRRCATAKAEYAGRLRAAKCP